MQVIVDNLLLNYHEIGKGPVVVCLHGWGDNSTTFEGLTKELEKTYQVVMLDLPGFGGSQAPPGAWNLENYVQLVAQWLKKIGVSKPFAIIGHSFGGSIATAGLAGRTLQADRLVLLASAGVRNRYSLRKKMFVVAAKTGKASTAWLPQSQKQKIRKGFYNKIGSDALLAPNLEETFKNIVSQDIQQEAAKIRIPTLLIYGSADSQTPVEDAKLLHKAIKNSRLEIIQNAGHFIQQEQPQKINELIGEFLND